MAKLTLIKVTHTIIWAIMASATFYIVYCGYYNIYSPLLWACIALITLEGAVLLVNSWSCPLTAMAKYSQNRKDNFDIYLPLYIAKYNKLLFTTLFIIGVLLVVF
ncbi:MAG: hypothetical protein ACM3PZ_01840 [Bacillota bacterium]